jgi:hypothetical protein
VSATKSAAVLRLREIEDANRRVEVMLDTMRAIVRRADAAVLAESIGANALKAIRTMALDGINATKPMRAKEPGA